MLFHPFKNAIIGDECVCLECGGRGEITPPHVLFGKYRACPNCGGVGNYSLRQKPWPYVPLKLTSQ